MSIALVFIVISVMSCSAFKGNVGRRCKSNRDCSKDECCVFRWKKGYKVCRELLLSGSRCNPFLKPGLSTKCSCTPGLTCALSSFRPWESRVIYKCVEVLSDPRDQEYEEI